MPHQLFEEVYFELKKHLYKEHSNKTWKRVLKDKIWAMDSDMGYRYCLNTDNSAHGTSKAVKKSRILLQTILLHFTCQNIFVSKKVKLSNHGQNIFELCSVLVQVQFATSKTRLDIYNYGHNILRFFDV